MSRTRCLWNVGRRRVECRHRPPRPTLLNWCLLTVAARLLESKCRLNQPRSAADGRATWVAQRPRQVRAAANYNVSDARPTRVEIRRRRVLLSDVFARADTSSQKLFDTCSRSVSNPRHRHCYCARHAYKKKRRYSTVPQIFRDAFC